MLFVQRDQHNLQINNLIDSANDEPTRSYVRDPFACHANLWLDGLFGTEQRNDGCLSYPAQEVPQMK